ncbi:hypothetical protein ACFY0P_36765 [Streptomyces sp. NPDC001714]|uniref:hypothetical protein n=1 Tax=Streptomyces sp. NPDC001714 TaxID=3364603 RepID=UPI0036CC85CD
MADNHKASDGGSTFRIGGDTAGVLLGGGQVMFSVAAGMAAAPFLQAVASHYGNKAAAAVDESAKRLIDRLLRREPTTRDSTEPEWVYAKTDGGWDLLMPVDISSEGLGQLVALGTAPPPPLAGDPTPRLMWQETKWVASGAVPNERRIVQHVWNVGESRWSDAM